MDLRRVDKTDVASRGERTPQAETGLSTTGPGGPISWTNDRLLKYRRKKRERSVRCPRDRKVKEGAPGKMDVQRKKRGGEHNTKKVKTGPIDENRHERGVDAQRSRP